MRKTGISIGQVPTNNKKHPMLNPASTNFVNSNKKLMANKQQKIKTQMNLTGPLPKNILSPKATANKSLGKTKHSQYFGGSDIVAAQN